MTEELATAEYWSQVICLLCYGLIFDISLSCIAFTSYYLDSCDLHSNTAARNCICNLQNWSTCAPFSTSFSLLLCYSTPSLHSCGIPSYQLGGFNADLEHFKLRGRYKISRLATKWINHCTNSSYCFSIKLLMWIWIKWFQDFLY